MNSLLIPEPPLQVLPTLARLIGLNDALFLQQLHYWLLRATREKDGRRWVFKSYEEWQEDFPFWSVKTIQRVVRRLEARRLIITTDEHNRMPIDKTKWYAIDYDALDKLMTRQVARSEGDPGHTTGQLDLFDWTECPDTTGQLVQMDRTECPDSIGQPVQSNNQRIETTTENTGPETTTTSADSRNAFSVYEAESFGRLTPHTADRLGDLIDTYGEVALVEALHIAVEQNVRKLSYVEGILNRRRASAKRATSDDGVRFVSGKYADEIDW